MVATLAERAERERRGQADLSTKSAYSIRGRSCNDRIVPEATQPTIFFVLGSRGMLRSVVPSWDKVLYLSASQGYGLCSINDIQ